MNRDKDKLQAAAAQDQRFIIFIFLFALTLRLAYLFFLKQNYFFYANPASDVSYYQNWAVDIIRNDPSRHQVFWGLPLYPYFLAGIKILSFGNDFLIRLVHLIIGSLNCVLVYLLAKKIFSNNTAQIASILAAANFLLIHYDWLMMPVTLLIALSLLIVHALLDLNSHSPKRQWLLVGVLIGVSATGDGKFLIFFPLLSLHLMIANLSEIKNFISRILFPLTTGVLIVLFAVCARNKIVGGDWILITAQSGFSLFSGNSPDATGFFRTYEFIRPTHEGHDIDQQMYAEKALGRRLKPSEVSGFWQKEAMKFITGSPKQYLNLLVHKFGLFFTDHEDAFDIDLLFQRKWKDRWDFNPFVTVMPLAMAGMILTWKLYPRTVPLTLLTASQLIFTLLYFLNDRHRASVLPVLIIFEAYTVCWLIERGKRRDFIPLSIVLISVIAMTVAFPPGRADPNEVEFLRASKAGPIFERHGEPQKARESYFQALRIHPDDATTLCNLGNAYFLDENYSAAVQYYQKAVALIPYQLDALYNLAFVNEKLANFDQATKGYLTVLELSPESYDAHFRLGEIYRTQGRCPEASRHFEESIQLNPSLKNHILPLIESCRTQ